MSNVSTAPDFQNTYDSSVFISNIWNKKTGFVTYEYIETNFPNIFSFNIFYTAQQFLYGLIWGNTTTSSLNYDGTITLATTDGIGYNLSGDSMQDIETQISTIPTGS